MINPNDTMHQQMMEVIREISLSEEQYALAEAYLSGEKGAEVLEQFPYLNLSEVPSEKFSNVFQGIKREDADRLFELLFTIGRATCDMLIPINFLLLSAREDVISCEAAKKTAVLATMQQWNPQYLHMLNLTMKVAEEKVENLKKAIAYGKDNEPNGTLILLALYFMTKYKEFIKERERQFEKEEHAQWAYDIPIEPEDIPLLQEYEESVLSHLADVFRNQMDADALQEITDAIINDQISASILLLVKKVNISDRDLSLCGGMAYFGYPFSVKLKNAFRICLAMNGSRKSASYGEAMLDIIMKISDGLFMSIKMRGGALDRIFDIAPREYLVWAVKKQCRPILNKQFHAHKDIYLEIMEEAEFGTANIMFGIIRNLDPALYEELLAKKKSEKSSREQQKLIDILVKDEHMHADLVTSYLRGEKPVDILYPIAEDLVNKCYNGVWVGIQLEEYCKLIGDFAFYHRAQIYMLIKESYCFWGNMINFSTCTCEGVKELFDAFAAENLSVFYQLKGLNIIHDYVSYSESKSKMVREIAADCFAVYLKDKREETIRAFSSAGAFGRFFGLHVLRKFADENKKEILAYSQDSAKMVKEELVDIVSGQKDWEEDVKRFLHSKKAAEREFAITVLAHWQGEGTQYQELFTQILEKEKNNKVRGLLERVLNLEAQEGSQTFSQEELVKELHKGNRKRTLAWAYETPFCAVHKKSGEEASEEYLQAILLCYSSVDGCGVSKKADILAENLQSEELARYVNELFDKWLQSGAEAKKKWVLYAASIHGGDKIVQKIQHQVQEWPKAARGAIAAEAVQALTLNPLPQALLIVDGIARKFKFKQIKSAAQKALEFAAEQLGITREELADRIVPDLGFDENMERQFDYGERKFRVTITPSLEIQVFDEAGKKLKNIPAPGKKDDEQKAAAAYDAFKQMKKQMKLTITSQKQRLEMALSIAREWSVESWKQLFVKNPIMHQFAIGLIWGIYENRTLVQSFRYMEDGSFNTEEEEEYQLPEQGQVGLVHPIELSAEVKEAWKQQLEDYEITQPISQLDRNIYTVTEEEAASKQLDRFGGCVINDLSLNGKLLDLGWYHGSVQDGGGFFTFYREDADVGLGVEMHFSGTYVGFLNEDVTVYDARFYKAGTIERGSYVYDEVEKDEAYFLGEVPERYFSEIIWQLVKATASSQERNENWKKESKRF